MKERIVITGAGVVSSLGIGQESSVPSLRSGVDRLAPARLLSTSHTEFPVGEVPLGNDELSSLAGVGRCELPRTTLMAMVALLEALEQSGVSRHNSGRTALLGGTTVGGMDISERYLARWLKEPDGITPEKMIASLHSCGASTDLLEMCRPGLFDLSTTLSTACSSAMNSLITGARLLLTGRADTVVAGGSESLTLYHLNGFKSLMILDQAKCRPFDGTRSGLNLGEGAAMLVLETERHALSRGATPLAVLSGWGNACDAFHQTATSPDGQGAFLAMTKALRTAALAPGDIDYVNAHGTATQNNDASEAAALLRVFGGKLPPVSSTKALTGHTTSASGAIETVFCLLALRYGFLPVNAHWSTPMADNAITPVTHPANAELTHIMCNSFGFGGNDSSLILGKYVKQ